MVDALLAPRLWRFLLWPLGAVILFLALMPHPPESVSLGWDKLNHMSAFLALALTSSMGYGRKGELPGPLTLRALWLGAGLLAFGGLIEIGQAFVPTRSCDWADLLADSVGIAVGAGLAMGVRWVLHHR